MARKVVKNDVVDTLSDNLIESNTNNVPGEFKELVKNYYAKNNEAKSISDIAKSLNNQIKEYMQNHEMSEAQFDNYTVKYSLLKSVSFDADILLACVKNMGATNLIKTKEYVDLEDLEQALYKHEIDGQKISSAQIIKEQVRLNVNKKDK